VLDIQNNVALIITECIMEQRAYRDVYKDITWEDSSLRKYLNGEFYNKFDAIDKARIIPVLNKNPDNQWYGSKGNQANNEQDESCVILAIRITRGTIFREHGAVRYNMDFVNKLETEEGTIR